MEVTTPNHSTIVLNIGAMLNNQLMGRPCRPWMYGPRVNASPVVSPDVMVACPPHEWDLWLPHTLRNPKVIIEVYSAASRENDLKKFRSYAFLNSLSDCVLVSENRVYVEHHHCYRGFSVMHILESLDDTLHLESVDCHLLLAEIYERLQFGDNRDQTRAAGV